MAQYIYLSAKTGRIVTEKWAKKHPATTVREKAKSAIKPYSFVKEDVNYKQPKTINV